LSYSVEASRKRLPLLLLAIPLTALLVWGLPHRSFATNVHLAYLAPAWVLFAHLLTALSYVITSRRVRPAWYLLKGSFSVYGSQASATHLAAAFLVALAEETVFRFALLPWLAAPLGPTAAVLIVSLTFSALHVRSGRRRSWPALVDYFAFAVVLGAITLATESLLPAVLLHTWRNYILRCLLVSREEYAAIQRQARNRDHAAASSQDPP